MPGRSPKHYRQHWKRSFAEVRSTLEQEHTGNYKWHPVVPLLKKIPSLKTLIVSSNARIQFATKLGEFRRMGKGKGPKKLHLLTATKELEAARKK